MTTFEAIKIGLASPDMIREWSHGEVTKPETINYRTLKPEKDGLFCERIFGPQKDWECHCGKYKRIRFKGKICDRCGVEVTRAKVRRERMGHIELAAPVSHIWYFKGIPSRMGLILDISPRLLEKVLYFASYIVLDGGRTPLKKKDVLTEKEYRDLYEKYEDEFRAGIGAEAIKELLAELDLDQLSAELKEELESASGQKKARIIKRLEVVEAFRQSHNRPEWMIMDVVPVIPPEIRPMVQLDGGRFATSDLNDLYRRVINRNNRLKRLIELGAPDIIVRNEKRMLQEAVDALIDNGRRGRPVTGPNNRPLKSLSDMLKGKQGRFRQNLLGKRVDYSGRSVIVVGPELKIYQCGLPKEMAIELFKPFVMKKLVEDGHANNIKSAKKMVERMRTEVWDALEVVIKEHPVMLNRAPTLHRLGIQAFEPVLVEGRALKLHPLVCTAFNADFDGDQMAVHVPLSAEAQAEARILMLSANNLLKPQDGRPVTVPTQDMILGSYYLTTTSIDEHDGQGILFATPREAFQALEEGKVSFPVRVFSSDDEALLAYSLGEIKLHDPIKLRAWREIDGVKKSKIIAATAGIIIFNRPIPQDLGLVNREDPEYGFDYEVTTQTGKKGLGKIIDACINKHGFALTAGVLDEIKSQGYKYSTQGAVTIAVSDMKVPPEKPEIIAKAEEEVDKITKKYRRGLISNEERYNLVVDAWTRASNAVAGKVQENFGKFNPIYMMADSGARGSIGQIRQLAGMRGLMANTSGRAVEIPIRSNFREGLTVLEYFISSKGARKGLADTALRTADSGYLTRRLVDVAQEVIIREQDCGTEDGLVVMEIRDGKDLIEPMEERLVGRYLAADFTDDKTGEILISKDKMLDAKDAKFIVGELTRRHEADPSVKVEIKIRSVLTCQARHGVCAKCYGANLANKQPVNAGEAVGIIAAQSIGEPGTQLTMRTFHTGGVAGDDITQGLPRVEELFEARKPKKPAVISEIAGKVELGEDKKSRKIIVTSLDPENPERKEYTINYGAQIKVADGQIIEKGDALTGGSINPHDIMAVKGTSAVQNYLIQEVQRVYRLQGVDINDRHIEVICRQMLRKIRVEDAGDTDLLVSSVVDYFEFHDANRKLRERKAAGETGPNGEELREAVGSTVLQGITKASLATESFLSAASFQETTRVLTDAAIKGKVDPLLGLKENVIIGKLIPAGTGLQMYRDVEVQNANGENIVEGIVEEN